MNRDYRGLQKLRTFNERYNYLRLAASVGESTFGYSRVINQRFYTSKRWREVRDKVIIRDEGCDLGMEGYDIYDKILVHHINPITIEDVESDSDALYDMNNLICVTNNTHNAIHYGDERMLPKPYSSRMRGDTKLWS